MKGRLVCLVCLVALALVFAGCCGNKGVFSQIGSSMNTINGVAAGFYDPYVKDSPEAQMAIAAALVAGPLADALQKQWCPDPAGPGVKALEGMAKSMTSYNKAMKSKGLIK